VTWREKPGDPISRRLSEALPLEIRYDHTAYMATCEIALTLSCAACWIRTCVHGSGPGLPGAVVYESPAPEFRLYRLTLTGEQTELPASGPRIALCTDGGALLRDAGGAELKLR
jgi:hypothetical protein